MSYHTVFIIIRSQARSLPQALLLSESFCSCFTSLEKNQIIYDIKRAMSRYFESFSATCKITFNVKETTKYLFSKIDKHLNGKNKAKRNADG